MLNEKAVADFLKDTWMHIWGWLGEAPNGHPRESELEFIERLREQRALHKALGDVRRAELALPPEEEVEAHDLSY